MQDLYGNCTLSPYFCRYAGNVTVRTLLENRAGRKPSDDTSPEKQESLDEPQSPVDKDAQGAEHLATTQEVTMLASLGTSISSITTVSVTPVASSLLATSPPLTTSVTMAVIGGSIPSGLLTKTVPGVIYKKLLYTLSTVKILSNLQQNLKFPNLLHPQQRENHQVRELISLITP